MKTLRKGNLKLKNKKVCEILPFKNRIVGNEKFKQDAWLDKEARYVKELVNDLILGGLF